MELDDERLAALELSDEQLSSVYGGTAELQAQCNLAEHGEMM